MIKIAIREQSLNQVLRRSLVFAALVSGVYFTIKSVTSSNITGAVIGTQPSNPAIVLAVALFLLALALTHFYER